MNAPAALRRAAEVVEACAISDETDDLIILWARAIERRAMGTSHTDEVDALARMLGVRQS